MKAIFKALTVSIKICNRLPSDWFTAAITLKKEG